MAIEQFYPEEVWSMKKFVAAMDKLCEANQHLESVCKRLSATFSSMKLATEEELSKLKGG